MRILVVHNHYRQRGGEDVVVEAEMAMLREHGHDVRLYSRDNAEIDMLSPARLSVETLWSQKTVSDIRQMVAAFQPHLIHSHNTFPLISPSLYHVAKSLRIPVVQTLHNFRLICPQAMLLRGGTVCEECIGRFAWPAVVHRCYHDSAMRTALLASMICLHRFLGSYIERVDAYVALTRFTREKFIQGGLPEEKIYVKPNFVDMPAKPRQAKRASGRGLYVGRLSEEKGIDCLISAVDRVDIEGIDVIGTGPLADRLARHSKFQLHGWMSSAEVYQAMAAAPYLIMPSIWYETFGLTIIEAFACGTPVIASDMGAMQELVTNGKTGLLFRPGDSCSLAEKIAWANAHPDEMKEMGEHARREYERKYTPEVNYEKLIKIYHDVLVRAKSEAARMLN